MEGVECSWIKQSEDDFEYTPSIKLSQITVLSVLLHHVTYICILQVCNWWVKTCVIIDNIEEWLVFVNFKTVEDKFLQLHVYSYNRLL